MMKNLSRTTKKKGSSKCLSKRVVHLEEQQEKTILSCLSR